MTSSNIRNIIRSILFTDSACEAIVNCSWDCSYDYPIMQKEILEPIKGQSNECKVDIFLKMTDESFASEYAEYENIIGNGNLNPLKPYKLLEYYIPCDGYSGLDEIIKYKNKPKTKNTIIYIGDKGSGKTATQNCWLHNNNSKLENENIFWVRCDGYKLYELWTDYIDCNKEGLSPDDAKKITKLGEYLDIQLFYVFCKYCVNEGRPFFDNILAGINSENYLYDKPSTRYAIHKYKAAKLYDDILQIKSVITTMERKTPDKKYSVAYDDILKKTYSNDYLAEMVRNAIDNYQFEKRKWLAASMALQSYMHSKGIFILKLLDGMDNLHINKRDYNSAYKIMITEVRRFIKEKPPANELRLIALREKTLIDIKKYDPLIRDAERHIAIMPIRHTPPCFGKVSNARYEYAKNNFIEDNLFNLIASNVTNNLPNGISDFHHSNLRTYLHNSLTLIAQVYYRIKQLGGGITQIPHHISILESRNRFLNGRLYLCSKLDWEDLNEELGVTWFNPFYYDVDEYPCTSPSEWYGLCCIRTFQLIKSYGNLNEDKIVSILNESYGYPDSLIAKAISNLRAFGMVDTKLKKEQETTYLVASKKGDVFIEAIFSDLDVIYYFALDTPLPSSFVNKKLINAHDNKLHHRTYYPYSSISTAITFISFMQMVKFIEQDNIANNSINISNALNYMKLPVHIPTELPIDNLTTKMNFVRNVIKQIEESDEHNKKSIKEYLAKITSNDDLINNIKCTQ